MEMRNCGYGLYRTEMGDPPGSIVAQVAMFAVLEDDRKLLGNDGLIIFDARDLPQVGSRNYRRKRTALNFTIILKSRLPSQHNAAWVSS